MGYSYLVKKNLELAARTFSRSIDVESDYQFDIIYYYGICQFRLGDYKKANANFKKVEKVGRNSRFLPINQSKKMKSQLKI